MLKSLTSNKLDDLEELRKMIKKTEKNLRGYSQSVVNRILRFIRLKIMWLMQQINAVGI